MTLGSNKALLWYNFSVELAKRPFGKSLLGSRSFSFPDGFVASRWVLGGLTGLLAFGNASLLRGSTFAGDSAL